MEAVVATETPIATNIQNGPNDSSDLLKLSQYSPMELLAQFNEQTGHLKFPTENGDLEIPIARAFSSFAEYFAHRQDINQITAEDVSKCKGALNLVRFARKTKPIRKNVTKIVAGYLENSMALVSNASKCEQMSPDALSYLAMSTSILFYLIDMDVRYFPAQDDHQIFSVLVDHPQIEEYSTYLVKLLVVVSKTKNASYQTRLCLCALLDCISYLASYSDLLAYFTDKLRLGIIVQAMHTIFLSLDTPTLVYSSLSLLLSLMEHEAFFLDVIVTIASTSEGVDSFSNLIPYFLAFTFKDIRLVACKILEILAKDCIYKKDVIEKGTRHILAYFCMNPTDFATTFHQSSKSSEITVRLAGIIGYLSKFMNLSDSTPRFLDNAVEHVKNTGGVLIKKSTQSLFAPFCIKNINFVLGEVLTTRVGRQIFTQKDFMLVMTFRRDLEQALSYVVNEEEDQVLENRLQGWLDFQKSGAHSEDEYGSDSETSQEHRTDVKKREGLFNGLTFRIPKVPESDLAKLITENGGTALPHTTKNTTHYIASKEEYEKQDPQVLLAEKRMLFVVTKNYVLEPIRAGIRQDEALYRFK